MTVQIDTTAEIEAVRLKTEGSHPAAPSSGHVLLYYVTGTAMPGLYTELSNGQKIGPFMNGKDPAVTGGDDYVFSADGVSTLPAGWSWDAQGSGTYWEQNGAGTFISRNAFSFISAIYTTLPASFTSKVTMKISGNSGGNGLNEGFGMILRESSSGKIAHFGLRATGATNLTFFSTSSGSVGTDLAGGAWAGGPVTDIYMQIRKNSASSWDFLWGDRFNSLYTSFYSVDVPGATLGFTPDQVGFGFLALYTGAKFASLQWIKFE